MKLTIKEIEQRLRKQKIEDAWIEQLRRDDRKGVQRAIKVWERRLEKERLRREAFISKCQFDDMYRIDETTVIVGVDEAGRGPLFGPVVTAAVVLPVNREPFIEVNDSKQLTFEQRERLEEIIKREAIDYTVHIQPASVIDRLNIYVATRQSMERSVEQLHVEPSIVLTDAMKINASCDVVDIVKGDAQSLTIAAASILAKTARDRLMRQYGEQYPHYRFEKHAGYGTKEHIEAIQTYGILKEHRRTFEPIRSMIKEER